MAQRRPLLYRRGVARLRTVRASEEFQAAFEAAESVVSSYFSDRVDEPERGRIQISGERYVLVRAASLSVEFFAFVEELYGPGRELEAADFARNILFDLAHALGRKDAASFAARMGIEEPIAKMAAGPVLFAHSGWASVNIIGGGSTAADDSYHVVYEHPTSFEADAWLSSGKTSPTPTCIMGAGYSSGWCQESFGISLVAAEVECRAAAGRICRFVMAPPHRIAEYTTSQRHPGAGPGPISIPDLFARKRLEDELRRAGEDLERRVQQRTEQLVRESEERRRVERLLQQQNNLESLGRLAGGIAHDFNNLLAVVLTNATIVDRALPAADPRRQNLSEITGACGRAAELTRQLLAFGRGTPGPGPEQVELDRGVADLGRMLERLVGDDVEIAIETRAPNVRVPLDVSALGQILVNLAVNARDAMPNGGTLRIETWVKQLDLSAARPFGLVDGSYSVLSVNDTGEGMDAATKSAIFEPFFTTKPEGKGTGLGLCTVYGLVKQAGGAIAVESEPGVGTTMTLYLPIIEGRPRAAASSPTAERPQSGHGEILLLVEDQALVRRALAALLERAGYVVLEAADGAAAREIADAYEVDVLLSDIMLPKMNGVVLAQTLQRTCPKMGVVLMSGNPGPYLEAMRAAGFDPTVCLNKPFDEAELLRAIELAIVR